MGTILLVLIGIAAALLIIAVLIQPGKGELSATMGGIGSQFGSMLGMRKAADMLQKITIGIAIFIFAGTLLINRFFLTSSEVARKPVTEGQEASAPASMPMQQQPAQAPADPRRSDGERTCQPRPGSVACRSAASAVRSDPRQWTCRPRQGRGKFPGR